MTSDAVRYEVILLFVLIEVSSYIPLGLTLSVRVVACGQDSLFSYFVLKKSFLFSMIFKILREIWIDYK